MTDVVSQRIKPQRRCGIQALGQPPRRSPRPPTERDPATGSNRPAGAQGPQTQSANESNHNAGAGSRLLIEDRTRRSPGPPPGGIQPQDPTATPESWAYPPPRRRPGVQDSSQASRTQASQPSSRQRANKHSSEYTSYSEQTSHRPASQTPSKPASPPASQPCPLRPPVPEVSPRASLT